MYEPLKQEISKKGTNEGTRNGLYGQFKMEFSTLREKNLYFLGLIRSVNKRSVG